MSDSAIMDTIFPKTNVSKTPKVLKCIRCAKLGHTIKTCPMCNYCKVEGHKISDCPKIAAKAEKVIQCNYCKVEGHKIADCPKIAAKAEYAARKDADAAKATACTICLKSSHTAKDCNKCAFCKKTDHKVDTCKDAKWASRVRECQRKDRIAYENAAAEIEEIFRAANAISGPIVVDHDNFPRLPFGLWERPESRRSSVEVFNMLKPSVTTKKLSVDAPPFVRRN